jgi:hypothetical protein
LIRRRQRSSSTVHPFCFALTHRLVGPPSYTLASSFATYPSYPCSIHLNHHAHNARPSAVAAGAGGPDHRVTRPEALNARGRRLRAAGVAEGSCHTPRFDAGTIRLDRWQLRRATRDRRSARRSRCRSTGELRRPLRPYWGRLTHRRQLRHRGSRGAGPLRWRAVTKPSVTHPCSTKAPRSSAASRVRWCCSRTPYRRAPCGRRRKAASPPASRGRTRDTSAPP